MAEENDTRTPDSTAVDLHPMVRPKRYWATPP